LCRGAYGKGPAARGSQCTAPLSHIARGGAGDLEGRAEAALGTIARTPAGVDVGCLIAPMGPGNRQRADEISLPAGTRRQAGLVLYFDTARNELTPEGIPSAGSSRYDACL